MTAAAFDFRPSDSLSALTSHFIDYAPPMRGVDTWTRDQLARKAAALNLLTALVVSRVGEVGDEERSNELRNRADNWLQNFAQLPSEERDSLLICHARVFAVIDPVEGNIMSDEVLEHLAIKLKDSGAEEDSIQRMLDAMIDPDAQRLASEQLAL